MTTGEAVVAARTPVAARVRTKLTALLGWGIEHPVLAVTVLALGLRLAVAVVSFVVNPVYLIPDEHQFVEVAAWVADGGHADDWYPAYGQGFYDHHRVFLWPMRFLFDVLFPSRLFAQLWVIPFGVATAAATTRVALFAQPRRWALVAGILVAVVPSQVLWSSTVLREALIWAALAGLALAVPLSLKAGWRWPAAAAVLAVGSIWGLIYLRPLTAVIALWALVLTTFLVAGRHHFRRICAVLLVGLVIPWSSGLGAFGYDFVELRGASLGTTRTTLALDAQSSFVPTSTIPGTGPGSADGGPGGEGSDGGPATTIPTADVVQDRFGTLYEVDNSVVGGLDTLPRGLVAVLLRPWLWEGSASLTLRVAAVENLAWYALYLLALVSLLVVVRRRDVYAFPTIVTGGLVLAAALTQGNLGTAFRHRGQIFWGLALLASQGAAVVVDRWRARAREDMASEPAAPGATTS